MIYGVCFNWVLRVNFFVVVWNFVCEGFGVIVFFLFVVV